MLTREIGRGAQGIVFQAREETMDRPVAVKILPRELTYTNDQIDRFRREAEAAGRLNHPNIVAVHALLEQGGHNLISQEFVAGGDLDAVLNRHREQGTRTDSAHCAWAAGVCRQLADALAHAHEHHVLHRDMKPANVLLTENGLPKITDFGLAKVEDKMGLSVTGTLMGTPHYMSPEQVAARKDIDGRTDIYSLGAMLYEMLTFRVPFTADSVQGIFVDILSRAPKPPSALQPGINPDLEAVCLRCLEKQPQERYGSAAELEQDLRRFLDGEPTRARPISVIGSSARWIRRQSAPALGTACLLVPTAAFAADLLLRRQAVDDVTLHDARVAVVLGAALLLIYPAMMLGIRLARGRAVGRIPAALTVLTIGALAVFGIREQRISQLHDADRAALALTLSEEEPGDRVSGDDLRAFAATWTERLGAADARLLASGWLKRKHPVLAAQWLARLTDTEPLDAALAASVHWALGEAELSRQAELRLLEHASASADAESWTVVGDTLLGMGRFGEARDAYMHAGRQENADRDELNFSLARAYEGLCQPDEALEAVDDFIKWRPNSIRAQRMMIEIAKGKQDWDTVASSIAALRRMGHEGRALWQEYVTKALRGEIVGPTEELAALVVDESTAQDVLGFIAYLANGRFAFCQTQSTKRAAEGQSWDAGQWSRHALAWLEVEDRARHAVLAKDAAAFEALVGLSAVALTRSAYDPENRASHFDDAVDFARRAVAIDPQYWECHYNLATALATRALAAVQWDESKLELATLEEILIPLESAVGCHGLELRPLNDAAHFLGRAHLVTGDEAQLQRALRYARRASTLGVLEEGTQCSRTAADRRWMSSAWTTRCELEERAGDLTGALASAESALATLHPGDARFESRELNVTRLRELVDAVPTTGSDRR